MALIKVGGESTVCRANSVRSLLRSSPADRQDTPSPSFSHIPLILTSPRRRTHHPPFAAITVCLSTTPPTRRRRRQGRTDGQFYPDADIGAAGTHSWVELRRRQAFHSSPRLHLEYPSWAYFGWVISMGGTISYSFLSSLTEELVKVFYSSGGNRDADLDILLHSYLPTLLGSASACDDTAVRSGSTFQRAPLSLSPLPAPASLGPRSTISVFFHLPPSLSFPS